VTYALSGGVRTPLLCRTSWRLQAHINSFKAEWVEVAVDSPQHSFPNDFDQDAFAAFAVELGVVDLLPGAEIELAVGDGGGDLPAHDLALEVGVAVVLAGAVVAVLRDRLVRGELFEPVVVVLDQAALRVVDVDAGRYMRCLIATSL